MRLLRFSRLDLILRSIAHAMRLEGWMQRRCLRPSFETLASQAPQDEAGIVSLPLRRPPTGRANARPMTGSVAVSKGGRQYRFVIPGTRSVFERKPAPHLLAGQAARRNQSRTICTRLPRRPRAAPESLPDAGAATSASTNSAATSSTVADGGDDAGSIAAAGVSASTASPASRRGSCGAIGSSAVGTAVVTAGGGATV